MEVSLMPITLSQLLTMPLILMHASEVTLKQIEAAFKSFTTRDDIAIVLIAQNIANRIRTAVDQHDKAVPAVLEIPSKDNPYDPECDGLLKRVKILSGV
jgi:V-type H+-transporting ATPase subunit F